MSFFFWYPHLHFVIEKHSNARYTKICLLLLAHPVLSDIVDCILCNRNVNIVIELKWRKKNRLHRWNNTRMEESRELNRGWHIANINSNRQAFFFLCCCPQCNHKVANLQILSNAPNIAFCVCFCANWLPLSGSAGLLIVRLFEKHTYTMIQFILCMFAYIKAAKCKLCTLRKFSICAFKEVVSCFYESIERFHSFLYNWHLINPLIRIIHVHAKMVVVFCLFFLSCVLFRKCHFYFLFSHSESMQSSGSKLLLYKYKCTYSKC